MPRATRGEEQYEHIGNNSEPHCDYRKQKVNRRIVRIKLRMEAERALESLPYSRVEHGSACG